MVKFIDNFLNKITMYRLMLYYLIFLVVSAVILSYLHFIPFNFLSISFEATYLAAICYLTNIFFGKFFKVPRNPESSLISGLILALIIGPYNLLSSNLISGILPLTLSGIFAMASKYLISINKKHIFNPAAFGALASAVLLGQGASWWVGNIYMFPFVLLGGILILKKLRRFRLILIFLLLTLIASFIMGFNTSLDFSYFIDLLMFFLASPIVFFASVMLIEPLTSPSSSSFQIIYASFIALSFNIYGRLPISIPFPLELSLLTGNIFSYIVSKNFRQVLKLKIKIQESHDVISFFFEPSPENRKIIFKSGQYLEWMLSHPHPDQGGARRYFTIASSPTEKNIILASKFYEKMSTFKQALFKMKPGDEIIVLDLGGEFTMPPDKNKKLVFIAGGIGITPFRSMAKWMIDTKGMWDIILLFSNKTKQDIVFKDIFDKAEKLGWKTIYVNTDTDGYIDEKFIREKVSDWKNRQFFISGPQPMVESFEKMLYSMGLSRNDVKRDYFPGYE